MKKLISIIISVAILLVPCSAIAGTDDNDLIQDGSYVQMGKYNNEPILWRCISTSDDDENGKLIISDKILCYKCFDAGRIDENGVMRSGCGYWDKSTLRTWLNSNKESGNIVWIGDNPPNEEYKIIYNSYDQESGFLSDNNFSNTELSVVKTVNQWMTLDMYQYDEVENGIYNFFQWDGSLDGRHEARRYGLISELSHIEGGMKRVVDSMFLMDDAQIYDLYCKYGVFADPTQSAYETWNHRRFLPRPSGTVTDFYARFSANTYWLRSSYGMQGTNTVQGENTRGFASPSDDDLYGVRPAFYLNEDNVRVISGSGEWNDPYVIDGDGDGQNGTAIFSQGKQVLADTQPIVENGEVLVPMKSVYESLGADVEYYDYGDKIITATLDDTTVVMQADNPELGNGTEVVTLDVSPQIINDTTMVSLQAIDASFGAKATYVEDLDRVVIDPPQPEEIEEGHWQSTAEIREYGKGKK